MMVAAVVFQTRPKSDFDSRGGYESSDFEIVVWRLEPRCKKNGWTFLLEIKFILTSASKKWLTRAWIDKELLMSIFCWVIIPATTGCPRTSSSKQSYKRWTLFLRKNGVFQKTFVTISFEVGLREAEVMDWTDAPPHGREVVVPEPSRPDRIDRRVVGDGPRRAGQRQLHLDGLGLGFASRQRRKGTEADSRDFRRRLRAGVVVDAQERIFKRHS